MKGPSLTAQLAAAHRAYHLMRAHPPILEDSVAIWLLSPPLRAVLRFAPLRWLFWERQMNRIRPVITLVVLRSRYAEDCLEASISDGCQQYVILGAGLDSWALRHENPGVHVLELDHPETQEWKKTRIIEQMGEFPSHLSLIPIDFERQALADVLCGGHYDRNVPAFVSWLGTIYYLTDEAIKTVFTSLARVCATGSRVVFDYFQPKSTMSIADLKLFEDMDRDLTKRGEPLRTLLNSDDVEEILQSASFRVVEDLSATEARQRYLNRRSDGLDIPDFWRLCCAELTAQPPSALKG